MAAEPVDRVVGIRPAVGAALRRLVTSPCFSVIGRSGVGPDPSRRSTPQTPETATHKVSRALRVPAPNPGSPPTPAQTSPHQPDRKRRGRTPASTSSAARSTIAGASAERASTYHASVGDIPRLVLPSGTDQSLSAEMQAVTRTSCRYLRRRLSRPAVPLPLPASGGDPWQVLNGRRGSVGRCALAPPCEARAQAMRERCVTQGAVAGEMAADQITVG